MIIFIPELEVSGIKAGDRLFLWSEGWFNIKNMGATAEKMHFSAVFYTFLDMLTTFSSMLLYLCSENDKPDYGTHDPHTCQGPTSAASHPPAEQVHRL